MASESVLTHKKAIVKEIEESLKKSQAVIFFKYHGLNVEDMSKLRRELRPEGGEIKVYKNTLTKRALDKLNINLDEHMEGPNAIMFGEDVLSSIKTLSKFAKTNKNLDIRVGIVDDKVVGLDVIKEYAEIPSYEGLLTMFVAGLMEHIRNFAISLDLIAEQKEESN